MFLISKEEEDPSINSVKKGFIIILLRFTVFFTVTVELKEGSGRVRVILPEVEFTSRILSSLKIFPEAETDLAVFLG